MRLHYIGSYVSSSLELNDEIEIHPMLRSLLDIGYMDDQWKGFLTVN